MTYEELMQQYLAAGGQPFSQNAVTGGSDMNYYDANPIGSGPGPVTLPDGRVAQMSPTGTLDVFDSATGTGTSYGGDGATYPYQEDQRSRFVRFRDDGGLAAVMMPIAASYLGPMLEAWAGSTGLTAPAQQLTMANAASTVPGFTTPSLTGALGAEFGATVPSLGSTLAAPVAATTPNYLLDAMQGNPAVTTPQPGIVEGATQGVVPQPTPALSSMGGGSGLTAGAAVGAGAAATVGQTGATAANAVPVLGNPASFINNPNAVGQPVVGTPTGTTPGGTPGGTTPVANQQSVLERLLSGDIKPEDFMKLLAGLQGAVQQRNYGQDMLDRAAAATPNRDFYEGLQRQSYEDPGSYLRGPDVQAGMDIALNKLQRSDAARGSLANDYGRQVGLQNYAFDSLSKYRQNLQSTVGQNQQTYSNQNVPAQQGMQADNSYMNSILNSLLSR